MNYVALMHQIREHIWGPVGSILLHIVVLVVLVNFAVTGGIEQTTEVQVTIMEPDARKLEEIDNTVQKELEKIETIQDVNLPPPTDAPIINDASQVLPGEGTGTGTGSGPGSGPGTGAGAPGIGDSDLQGLPIANVQGPLIMKGLRSSLYGNRSAGGRASARAQFRGTQAGEDAVLRALRWLKKNQQADGSWAGEEISAMTGLALLCFLAHGEVPSSVEFGPTVEKAIKFMIAKQAASGNNTYSANGYAHGIATYAMSEAYAMTKILAVKDSMEKGIQFIIDGQQDAGGFDYNYKKGERWDTSVSGWQFQAFKAAKMAGAGNPGLDKAIEKSIAFLKNYSFSPKNNMFQYSLNLGDPPASGTWTMTGAGVLCMQLLGHAKDPESRAGLASLDQQTCVWNKEGKNPVYGWYYVTQAKFQDGGSRWEAWNKLFAKTLVDVQLQDGHWEGGDWGKEVYTTTLCTLMLEVYYRYLPTYKKVEDAAPVKATSEDDIVIDVS